MEYENQYLNELFNNIDSPVAMIELWDFAQQEYNEDPNNPASKWIIAFSELFKWQKSADAESTKSYYQNVQLENAFFTLQFLEVHKLDELISIYSLGINAASEDDKIIKIDKWLDENDELIERLLLQIVLSKKDWFYEVV